MNLAIVVVILVLVAAYYSSTMFGEIENDGDLEVSINLRVTVSNPPSSQATNKL